MENLKPLISVIVPTFNRAKLLEETVNAILSQTVQDFELIVVDNLSDDGTEEFVKKIKDDRVRYFRNPNNGIIAVNRNFGIRQAKGKYIAFCDDDDLWLPTKLGKQLAHFPEGGISFVSTDFIPMGEPGFFRKVFKASPGTLFRDFLYEEILLVNPVISSSVVARKDFLLEVGGFDENPDFKCIEDWELWLRLSRKGRGRILAEPLVRYRISQKAERDTRQIRMNELKILEKHRRLGYIESSAFQKARGNRYISIGKAFLDKNDREGVSFFRRGLTQSQGGYQKLKAIAGLLLFYLPLSWRARLLNRAYSKNPAILKRLNDD
jgi:glycosyltransferase involved in cell wall biosynthesis